MGGKGSGRKPRKETVVDFKPAKKPDRQVSSMPAKVGMIKTSGGCRFGE
ncbi:MAG: hypothetical protein NC300_11310 [Bacteroidales bacterium]|nr:hypothetical protein [Clostridium sp.]MCM1204719.1 hypothetical protein [Bacteroidales bacterium]